jgi:hypothetical protein
LPREIDQETPISKITRAKWIGGLAQLVECLLYKFCSNPSSTKKKVHKRSGEGSVALERKGEWIMERQT